MWSALNKVSITATILHDWHHSGCVMPWVQRKVEDVIIYQGCLGTRKVFPRCGRIFLIKKPPVDSSDLIPHLEWTMFGWLGSILKEEQYTVEGFPDWTNIQFYIRASQHPASLFPGVLLKVALRILQVLLPSDWRQDQIAQGFHTCVYF